MDIEHALGQLKPIPYNSTNPAMSTGKGRLNNNVAHIFRHGIVYPFFQNDHDMKSIQEKLRKIVIRLNVDVVPTVETRLDLQSISVFPHSTIHQVSGHIQSMLDTAINQNITTGRKLIPHLQHNNESNRMIHMDKMTLASYNLLLAKIKEQQEELMHSQKQVWALSTILEASGHSEYTDKTLFNDHAKAVVFRQYDGQKQGPEGTQPPKKKQLPIATQPSGSSELHQGAITPQSTSSRHQHHETNMYRQRSRSREQSFHRETQPLMR